MKTEKNLSYSRTNPFIAQIKQRERLSKPGSKKNTHHLVLDISGSDIHYEVGDSIGVYPSNDPDLVAYTLKAMKATGQEIITDKQGESRSLKDFLTKKANITEISKKFLMEMAKRQTNLKKKAALDGLLHEDQTEALKEYQSNRELWDTLEENREVIFEPEELCLLLMPLLPRLYSISSAKSVVETEVHLTVAMLEYESNQLLRRGVCTHYLCNLAPLNEKSVPIYIQPHHGFTLPQNQDVPIIMVGPGTGIAPFRAFMQERVHKKASGNNWLIFGEWNHDFDFFYKDYWNELILQNQLRLDVAFSRDQADKIYVQHRLLEKGEEIYNWIEKGAHFYVCGDAKRMARDVEAALLQIFKQFGNHTEEKANAYLKELRAEKRYLRDVY